VSSMLSSLSIESIYHAGRLGFGQKLPFHCIGAR
jgi:hypothetical protein